MNEKKVSLCFKHKNIEPTDFLGTVIIPVKSSNHFTQSLIVDTTSGR
jgi:hypothetical protein